MKSCSPDTFFWPAPVWFMMRVWCYNIGLMSNYKPWNNYFCLKSILTANLASLSNASLVRVLFCSSSCTFFNAYCLEKKVMTHFHKKGEQISFFVFFCIRHDIYLPHPYRHLIGFFVPSFKICCRLK